MDMEIAALASVYRPRVSDMQALILGMALSSPDGLQTGSDASSREVLQPVPMLDWPATLFDDTIISH
jgi:hypothetical protein